AAVTVLIKPLFIAALLAGAVVGFRKGWRPLGVFTVGLALPLVSTAVWLIVSGNTAVISHFGKMNAIGHSFGSMLHLALTAAGRHPFAFLILLFGLWTVDKNSPR
ncbi:MAG: hypothetical protein HY770_04725, partial [Chitinivibrionia bacterium]|nr:hypothetical protein [Chitinivibrionia bacterium]